MLEEILNFKNLKPKLLSIDWSIKRCYKNIYKYLSEIETSYIEINFLDLESTEQRSNTTSFRLNSCCKGVIFSWNNIPYIYKDIKKGSTDYIIRGRNDIEVSYPRVLEVFSICISRNHNAKVFWRGSEFDIRIRGNHSKFCKNYNSNMVKKLRSEKKDFLVQMENWEINIYEHDNSLFPYRDIYGNTLWTIQ